MSSQLCLDSLVLATRKWTQYYLKPSSRHFSPLRFARAEKWRRRKQLETILRERTDYSMCCSFFLEKKKEPKKNQWMLRIVEGAVK